MDARRSVVVAFVVGLVVASLAAAMLRWVSRPDFGVGPSGALHSVMLTNGQVYYGTLDVVARNAVVLNHVYYVQIASDANNQRLNKLVSRAENDWHGPTSMSIPFDKIVMIEVVGPESSVAKLIAEAKQKRGP